MQIKTVRQWCIALCLLAGPLMTRAQPVEVIVGAEDGWHPYSGLVDGKPAGLAQDIVRAAFLAVGVVVKFQPLPYANCMNKVGHGILLACFNTPRTSDVESQYLWHDKPLYTASAFIYARAESLERNLTTKDLIGKRIIVTNGYGYGEGFDGNKAIRQEMTVQDINGLRMLIANRAPYFAAFDRAVDYLESIHPDVRDKTRQVGFIADTGIYMAFSKTFPASQEFLRRFNEGQQKILSNGEYKRIIDSWDSRYVIKGKAR